MNRQEKVPKPSLWLVYAILAVLILWAGYWLAILQWGEWEKRGLFGDSFGAVNTLFSGLAFAGLMVAIFLQQRQLKLQREDLELQQEELKLTREELKGQREQMELQNETLKLQIFENKFFQLMRLYDEITRTMQIVLKEQSVKRSTGANKLFGKECFEYLWNEYNKRYKQDRNSLVLEETKEIDDGFYYSYQTIIGAYFNHLYIILEYIEGSNVVDKQFYADLVRVQLSYYELLLIFYLCMDLDRFKDLKILLTKYSILSSLNLLEEGVADEILLDPYNDLDSYEKKAFRKSIMNEESNEE